MFIAMARRSDRERGVLRSGRHHRDPLPQVRDGTEPAEQGRALGCRRLDRQDACGGQHLGDEQGAEAAARPQVDDGAGVRRRAGQRGQHGLAQRPPCVETEQVEELARLVVLVAVHQCPSVGSSSNDPCLDRPLNDNHFRYEMLARPSLLTKLLVSEIHFL
ncbi:hypothetical protein [Micromonospora sp. b486]|uniref:hypothetical protein n=1 Tax=Micromonospora sp. b486 TaxID=3053986 RepID=UPI00259CE08B|nr:hypothetical protein [Micromonospora sp. b486]MDM4778164.1 hypothetical protein [Micromonospora sp. b486]